MVCVARPAEVGLDSIRPMQFAPAISLAIDLYVRDTTLKNLQDGAVTLFDGLQGQSPKMGSSV
jgi:hypothetical protein